LYRSIVTKQNDYLGFLITDVTNILPSELIKKEGPALFQRKHSFAGVGAKKGSWTNAWCIVAVGILLLYKDDPSKTKKVR
jgi:hypothetical protein